MNTRADTLDQVSRRPRHERLITTLIFALLAHGIIILGIGFKAIVPGQPPGTAVNITLSTTKAAEAPREAYYLARFNQIGPGNTTVRVPERPQSFGVPFADSSSNLAGQLARLLPNPALNRAFTKFEVPDQTLRDRLITTTADSRSARGQPLRSNYHQRRAVFVRLPAPARGQPHEPTLSNVELPQLYGPHPEDRARAANARAAMYAPYLLHWQRRIEQVGTAQFAKLVPNAIKRGHLTLSVTLGSDGGVRSISIVKRSRHPELDAAALKIIRMAAPFSPFPPDLRAHSDALTFAYRWNFIRHGDEGSLGLGGNQPSGGDPRDL